MNDVMIVEFEDRDPTRGIRSAEIAAIADSLAAMFGEFGPEGENLEFVLVSAFPGSLRLSFKAVAAEFESGPVKTIASLAAIASIIFANLQSLGVAKPQQTPPPVMFQVSITPPAAESCVRFATTLQRVDNGRIVIHAPDCPSLLIEQRAIDPGSAFDRLMRADGSDGERPFAGKITWTSSASFLRDDLQSSAFIGKLGNDPENSSQELIVYWQAKDRPADLQSTFFVGGRLISSERMWKSGLIKFNESVRSTALAHRRLAMLIVDSYMPSTGRGHSPEYFYTHMMPIADFTPEQMAKLKSETTGIATISASHNSWTIVYTSPEAKKAGVEKIDQLKLGL